MKSFSIVLDEENNANSASILLLANLGWCYFAAVDAIVKGSLQLQNDQEYRQVQNKIQAVLKIVSGVELMVFSYNPWLTQAETFTGRMFFASAGCTLFSFLNLINDSINVSNTLKKMDYLGWVEEKLKKYTYKTHYNQEVKYLEEKILTQCRAYAFHNPDRSKAMNALLKKHGLTEVNINSATVFDIDQNIAIQEKLCMKWEKQRKNLVLGVLNFVGMVFLTLAPFVPLVSVCSGLFFAGLFMTTIVAGIKILSSEQAVNCYNNCKQRLFGAKPEGSNEAFPNQLSNCKRHNVTPN